MQSDYSYWTNALAGKFGPVHDGEPQPGFYRKKNKGTADRAVAIWWDDNTGAMVAVQDADAVIDARDVWTWVCQNPITEAVYRAVAAGKPWPDDITTSNNPPADEAEKDEIQSAIDAAMAELRKQINSQEDADRIANHKQRLAALYKAQNKAREDEKAPFLEGGRAVDAKYKPALEALEKAGKTINDHLTKWMIDERRRLAQAQAEALQKDPEAPIEAPRPKAGTGARSVGLRTVITAKITDYNKALLHFAEHAEVRELVQKLANAQARAGIAGPGFEVEKGQIAA